MALTKEIRAELENPLPPEAITQHPTKTYLSSIKGIYVTERLNDVFGVGAWKVKTEFVKEFTGQKANKNGTFPIMIVTKTTLEIPEHDIYFECFGGNDNEDAGDAFKGATTDALSKIGSWLGIGIDVYKGKVSHAKGKGVQNQELPPF